MTMEKLEWFVVLRYDRTSDIMNVNDSRKCLFTQKCRNFLTQQIGDGERTLQVGNITGWDRYGPQFQKRPKHATN